MPARLVQTSINLVAELEARRRERPAGADGALACFIGSMRDFNAGDRVSSMTLEHYPEMTQAYLDELCSQAIRNWQLNDMLIVHRYGELLPGDDIVLVACWSAHRADAFDACRASMEKLKSEAPFWKHESTEQGERWVHDIAGDSVED